MVKKYRFGQPFPTDAVTVEIALSEGEVEYGTITEEQGFSYEYVMSEKDIVYGLGENVRGINKRGFEYISFCTDDPRHHEDKKSLYGAHNFLIVDGKETFGIFIDYPSELKFDIGYTRSDLLWITCKKADLDFYVITGESAYDIAKQFRGIIGRSYIPPKFAFGYGQSRWGYATKEDFRKVVREHREAKIPLDMVYMDIDYMQDFKDFTVSEDEMQDFPDFVKEMKDQHIHLIPIIDAGVKIEEGYDVYEEGVENDFFCKYSDGRDFVACVWPGYTHFPDVLNPKAREWFGGKYQILTDQGIDGFWNDMNEPAIFYTPESLEMTDAYLRKHLENPYEISATDAGVKALEISNNRMDYRNMYHNVNGQMVCHEEVHNLFGYNMTRAAGEAFERFSPDKRILLFSRSSYVGMHRYGGIWQGDNLSWWSHLAMNLCMMPSLNMVGFLYTGADLGGFGSDTTRDLMLRWLALGVFTPLMRNHSAKGTREQEFYQFENADDFRAVIRVRYRLLPYIYSEFMKAALSNDLMFKPMGFEWPEDEIARQTEDQMLIGDSVMIAPVMAQNARGRMVYLPEEMHFLKFKADGSVVEEKMAAGLHYIEVLLDEVALFVRKGKAIPVAEAGEYVEEVSADSIVMAGYEGGEYLLYDDDGLTRDYEKPEHFKMLVKKLP